MNTSESACASISVDYYNVSDLLYGQAMNQYNSFACNSTFNQTRLGTYTFDFSTGDSGSIIVEVGYQMMILWFFALAIVVGLVIFGFMKEDVYVLSFSGILMIVMGFFLWFNGFSVFINIVTQTFAMILWGLGAYVIVKSNIEDLPS